MKIRTCPFCDYKYPFGYYIRHFLAKHLWSEWNCINCGNKITFNQKRRFSVATIFGLILIALLIIENAVFMSIGWLILFFAVSLFGAICIYTFDTFEKCK